MTQNFVSEVNLPHVLRFLASGSPELVSGCALDDRASLHERFLSALQRERPDVMERLHELDKASQQSAARRKQLSSLFSAEQPASKKVRMADNLREKQEAFLAQGVDGARDAGTVPFCFSF